MRKLAPLSFPALLLYSASTFAYVYISGLNSLGDYSVRWTNSSYNTCYIPPSPGSSVPRLQTIPAYKIKEWFNGSFVEQHTIYAGGTGSYNPPKYYSFADKEPGQYVYEVIVTSCSSSGQTSYSAGTTNLTLTVTLQSRDGKPVIFIHTDMLGSPVAETDEQGNVIQ